MAESRPRKGDPITNAVAGAVALVGLGMTPTDKVSAQQPVVETIKPEPVLRKGPTIAQRPTSPSSPSEQISNFLTQQMDLIKKEGLEKLGQAIKKSQETALDAAASTEIGNLFKLYNFQFTEQISFFNQVKFLDIDSYDAVYSAVEPYLHPQIILSNSALRSILIGKFGDAEKLKKDPTAKTYFHNVGFMNFTFTQEELAAVQNLKRIYSILKNSPSLTPVMPPDTPTLFEYAELARHITTNLSQSPDNFRKTDEELVKIIEQEIKRIAVTLESYKKMRPFQNRNILALAHNYKHDNNPVFISNATQVDLAALGSKLTRLSAEVSDDPAAKEQEIINQIVNTDVLDTLILSGHGLNRTKKMDDKGNAVESPLASFYLSDEIIQDGKTVQAPIGITYTILAEAIVKRFADPKKDEQARRKQFLFLFDTCFSGNGPEEMQAIFNQENIRREKVGLRPLPTMIVIASSEAHTPSFMRPNFTSSQTALLDQAIKNPTLETLSKIVIPGQNIRIIIFNAPSVTPGQTPKLMQIGGLSDSLINRNDLPTTLFG